MISNWEASEGALLESSRWHFQAPGRSRHRQHCSFEPEVQGPVIADMKNTKIDNDAERLLQGTRRELEEARRALATAAIAAHADRSIARQSLEKAQDLSAELFRVRNELKGARLDADEGYARVLDLEMEVRQEQARLAELRVQNERLGEHLRQALALHQQDGARWQAELGRVLKVHEQDTVVWQAEVDRVRAAADDTARTLTQVLASRSWRMTRGIRQVVERLHGRRWEDPKMPAVGDTPGAFGRSTPSPNDDD